MKLIWLHDILVSTFSLFSPPLNKLCKTTGLRYGSLEEQNVLGKYFCCETHFGHKSLKSLNTCYYHVFLLARNKVLLLRILNLTTKMEYQICFYLPLRASVQSIIISVLCCLTQPTGLFLPVYKLYLHIMFGQLQVWCMSKDRTVARAYSCIKYICYSTEATSDSENKRRHWSGQHAQSHAAPTITEGYSMRL